MPIVIELKYNRIKYINVFIDVVNSHMYIVIVLGVPLLGFVIGKLLRRI